MCCVSVAGRGRGERSGKTKTGLRGVSNATQTWQVVCGLAGRERPPQDESLPNEEASPAVHGQDAPHRSGKKSPRLGTIADWCAAWAEAHPDKQRADGRVAREVAACFGNAPLRELNSFPLINLVSRWKQTYSPWTRNLRYRALRKLLRHLASHGAPDIVGELPKERRPRPRAVIASAEEIRRMLDLAPPWLRCFLLLCAHCGLRGGTAMRVAPMHYNSERRTIKIDTKGGIIIEQPVSPELEQLFDLAPKDDPTTPYIWLLKGQYSPNATFHGISSTIYAHWRALKKKAGVNPNLRPHDLRRTLAVTAYELHRDIRVVQQILGHSSLGSTAHYLEHRDTSKLRSLMAELWKPMTEVKQ